MDRTEHYASPLYCINMAKEATRVGCWLQVKNEWITPKDFITQIDTSKYISPYKPSDIKIVDPVAALKKLQDRLNNKRAELDREQEKINDFTLKVVSYFKENK